MHIQIVEMAKSAHERDKKLKKNECQKNKEPFVATRLDPSVIPVLDSNRKYVQSYSLAPVTTPPNLWRDSPDPLFAGDFAYSTHKGQPTGTLGSAVGHDSNGHLIEMCECLSFGT